MKNSIKYPLLIIITIVLIALAVFIRMIWITEHELDAHIRIHKDVQKQLGFQTDTPYEDGKEVFIISKIEPHNQMAKAGFMEGDHFPFSSTTVLYKSIVFGQGKEIIIPVIRKNKKIKIKIQVPHLKLRDDPFKLHWWF